jgi:orotate phosphoribosyltransferase
LYLLTSDTFEKQLLFAQKISPSTPMLTVPEAKQRLLTILKTKSVFHGDFLLASGQRSNYYVDCRLTTLDPEGATLVGQVLFSVIADQISTTGVRVDAVGGLTMGADPISLAIGMRSFQQRPDAPLKCFVVRKEPKGHGQGKQIEGNFSSGDSVVVIDDVVTKGDSTLKAVEAVEKEGGKVAFVVVLVDRQQGGREKIEQRGYKVLSAFTRDDLLQPASHSTEERAAA